MKKLFYLFCLAVVSSVVFSACEKEEVIVNDAVEVSPIILGMNASHDVVADGERGLGRCQCYYRVVNIPVSENLTESEQSKIAEHYPGVIPFAAGVIPYSAIGVSYMINMMTGEGTFNWQTFIDGDGSITFQGLPTGWVPFRPTLDYYSLYDIQKHQLDMFSYVIDDDFVLSIEVECFRENSEETELMKTFNFSFERPEMEPHYDYWSELVCLSCVDDIISVNELPK